MTAWRKPPQRREDLAARAGITGTTTIHSGTAIFVCEEVEPKMCEQFAPGAQEVSQAFNGPWWTNRAAASLTGPGATVVAAPARTVLGIAAECFTLATGTAPPELCVDPANGVLLYYRTGTPGSNGYTITTLEYSLTVTDADFVPPYPVN